MTPPGNFKPTRAEGEANGVLFVSRELRAVVQAYQVKFLRPAPFLLPPVSHRPLRSRLEKQYTGIRGRREVTRKVGRRAQMEQTRRTSRMRSSKKRQRRRRRGRRKPSLSNLGLAFFVIVASGWGGGRESLVRGASALFFVLLSFCRGCCSCELFPSFISRLGGNGDGRACAVWCVSPLGVEALPKCARARRHGILVHGEGTHSQRDDFVYLVSRCNTP